MTDDGALLGDLIKAQAGVVSRRQALERGMSRHAISARLAGGRWQIMYRGVYATFSGEPCRLAWLWAAVLLAGDEAILSHETAAELDGLLDAPRPLIHVSVPENRQVRTPPGVICHRSDRFAETRHPVRLPPRTRVEETVLDLAQSAASLDQAIAWLSTACCRRATTPSRLLAAMERRTRMRRRAELTAALSEVTDGAHSLLEVRYVRRVERPHGLPRGRRQRRVVRDGRVTYDDVCYEDQGLIVELDGGVAHPLQTRRHDRRRDNVSALRGEQVLRYDLADVTDRPCATAAEIAGVLTLRGWTGVFRPCGGGCPHFARPLQR